MGLTLLNREIPQNQYVRRIANLAGYPLVCCNQAQLKSLLFDRIGEGKKSLVFFANSNFVVKCLGFRQAFQAEDVIVLNDGIAVEAANWMINGDHFVTNMNGTDLVPYLLLNAPRPFRIFLYGSRPDVVAQAAKVYAQMGHNVVGFRDGFSCEDREVRAAIEYSEAELVLVALGNPIQEQWILRNARDLTALTFIGVGALFDFASGTAIRAPNWMRRAHLEWLFRLLREPKRLARRYSVDMLRFFAICWRDRKVATTLARGQG